MKNLYDIIKRPIITEKSTSLVENNNTEKAKLVKKSEVNKRGGRLLTKSNNMPVNPKYVFEVSQDANKVDVKKAIEEIYKVKVLAINIINVSKKAKKVGRYTGFTPAVKKAIVTLEAGHTLDVYNV